MSHHRSVVVTWFELQPLSSSCNTTLRGLMDQVPARLLLPLLNEVNTL